jgi:hypothetical protein
MPPSQETSAPYTPVWQDPQTDQNPDTERNPQNVSDSMSGKSRGRITIRRVDELRPQPSFARLGIKVPISKLNALIEQGEGAFFVPLAITCDGIVIDGYARLEVARLQNRVLLECIEYELSEPEALHWFLLSHLPSPGLVPFNRIVLALGLENHFKQKARLHQQVGGINKGSSKLTEAERVDVRKQIAAAACVSVGTLTHVKQLLRTADPAILQALRDGEIKVDRAWRWSKQSRDVQRENLKSYLRDRGMDKAVEGLVARQVRRLRATAWPKQQRENPGSCDAISRLALLTADVLTSVNVIIIRAPGKILALSDEVAQTIGFSQESQ